MALRESATLVGTVLALMLVFVGGYILYTNHRNHAALDQALIRVLQQVAEP